MMAKRFKSTRCTGTLGGAIEAAAAEVAELFDEMENWASNMEGANMEHMPKYDEVSAAKDELEQIKDALEGLDVPQAAADLEVSYMEYRPYGRKGPSRSMRLSNAESQFDAAKSRLEELIEELNEEPECTCANEEDKDLVEASDHEEDCPVYVKGCAEEGEAMDPDELQTLVDDLDQCDFSSVSFPGMFG